MHASLYYEYGMMLCINKKASDNPWFLRTKEPPLSPFPVFIHKLNHVSVFPLLLFVCLSCPWASPYLRTLADTTLLHGCWLINIRD